MSTANFNVDGSSPRVCPVASKLLQYREKFGDAAYSAIRMESDLSATLGGGEGNADSFTLADLKAVEPAALESAHEDLEDLRDQVDFVLDTLRHVIDLRDDPDAEWIE